MSTFVVVGSGQTLTLTIALAAIPQRHPPSRRHTYRLPQPVHLGTIVGRHQIQQVLHTEATQGHQRLLSTVAQTVETQIEAQCTPTRMDGDWPIGGPISTGVAEAREYSELNIVSLAGGVAALAATALRGSTVVATMFALLRVVVRNVDNCIREDVHLARLTVKVKKLLSSFSKILDIMGPEIVQASRIILDGLAEAMASVINEVDKLSAAISTEEWYEQFLRAFATDTVRSTIANVEKAVDDAEDQFNVCLTVTLTRR
ncbi:hypothetical protein ARMGADRAFT_1164756 [Armillaria gallica]|uniref:Uncharacterized protein n=1 Tax=Armillaria gallica TaxID=47427 RepID=A0A2H3DSU4_ARMGA|nr:hypothetical protein ARMGADRAFT_1164756 [Armillaria gallica]